MGKSALGWPLSVCPPCSEPSFPNPAAENQNKGWGSLEGGEAAGGRQRLEEAQAPTSLQLAHPLQQRVQRALGLLPVSRGLVVQQGLLVLQLRDLAQQLPLQLPQPPLEHLSEVAG